MLKKAAALTVASTVLFSTSSSVLAASYQEVEKAALTQAVKGFSSYWDTVLSQQEKALAGSKANMSLTLEDGGKAQRCIRRNGFFLAEFSFYGYGSFYGRGQRDDERRGSSE